MRDALADRTVCCDSGGRVSRAVFLKKQRKDNGKRAEQMMELTRVFLTYVIIYI